MSGSVALDHALELTQSPHLASAMRRQDLPSDVIVTIRIAASCGETCWEAVQATQLGPDKIREAARTYLQLVLFSDSGDCFRVLGVRPGASKSQMREHMRWLLQWLHPDRNTGDWESVYAERVISAWREAKSRTAEIQNRQQLVSADASQRFDAQPKRSDVQMGGRLRAPMRWVPIPIDPPPRQRFGTPLRVGAAVLVLGLVMLIVPQIEPVAGWIGASRSATLSSQ